jgi:hypothetical protein
MKSDCSKCEKGWNNPALLPSTGHNGSGVYTNYGSMSENQVKTALRWLES